MMQQSYSKIMAAELRRIENLAVTIAEEIREEPNYGVDPSIFDCILQIMDSLNFSNQFKIAALVRISRANRKIYYLKNIYESLSFVGHNNLSINEMFFQMILECHMPTYILLTIMQNNNILNQENLDLLISSFIGAASRIARGRVENRYLGSAFLLLCNGIIKICVINNDVITGALFNLMVNIYSNHINHNLQIELNDIIEKLAANIPVERTKKAKFLEFYLSVIFSGTEPEIDQDLFIILERAEFQECLKETSSPGLQHIFRKFNEFKELQEYQNALLQLLASNLPATAEQGELRPPVFVQQSANPEVNSIVIPGTPVQQTNYNAMRMRHNIPDAPATASSLSPFQQPGISMQQNYRRAR